MNTTEALDVLAQEMAPLRGESYAGLVERVGSQPLACERMASSGARYQIEIQFFWDGHPGGDVRVLGSVDDGGWRAFLTVSRSFIKASDGSFVGE